ncbi:hypothetical protein ETAE_3410 [Edwardsiella piscicida]|uniref:Uncharacterized protein n=1 Tax=Edwardsiella piscicida TaxID=1263550 RepID=A0AAU8PYK3_EDWPI|nr:hypothetical protein ETAE_3410 [Edwardsiella tarda EIB202]
MVAKYSLTLFCHKRYAVDIHTLQIHSSPQDLLLSRHVKI